MPAAPEETLPALARELNEALEQSAPEALAMLSALGRRLYFPKGILSQSAEAKQHAHRFDATIGIATEGGEAMHLPSIHRHLEGVEPDDAYPYAPAGGRPGLRERWREKLLAENPSLRGKRFGQPIVTSALTHGLSVVGELFADPGDALLLPDKLWGNYRLGFEVKLGARIATYPFYASGGFNVEGLREALRAEGERAGKLLVMLNFPNNPTGYMPTDAEGEAIASALLERAEAGTKLVVLLDDAYFGLFYHLGGRSMTESLFGRLANRHPNLLSVKLDGATKELFVWGLRCGFLTFAPGRAEGAEEACAALEAKVRGAIRGGISNSPHLSQTLVEKALAAPSIEDERKEKLETLRARAEKVFEVARAERFRECWTVYPFNSGYFMCVELHGVEAEPLRRHLLERHGVGLVATGKHDLRVAFSCLELEEIEPLFEAIAEGVRELS